MKTVIAVVLVVGAVFFKLRSGKDKKLSLKHIPGPQASSYVLGESIIDGGPIANGLDS